MLCLIRLMHNCHARYASRETAAGRLKPLSVQNIPDKQLAALGAKRRPPAWQAGAPRILNIGVLANCFSGRCALASSFHMC